MSEFGSNEFGQEPSTGSSPTQVFATKGQRFGGFLLDLLFIMIYSVVIGFVLGLIGLADLVNGLNNNLLGIIILLIYYIPLEARGGKTIGKMIIGTKAVREDGLDLNMKDVLFRTVCRFIPFEAFSFLFGDGPGGWHDSISKTKVISIK